MRNILAHIPHKENECYASYLRAIKDRSKCPKVIEILEVVLEDALAFLKTDARKINSNVIVSAPIRSWNMVR